jgi:hypothetical protein
VFADPLPSCADLTGDNLFPQIDLAEMLFGNAYAFPGAVYSRWEMEFGGFFLGKRYHLVMTNIAMENHHF